MSTISLFDTIIFKFLQTPKKIQPTYILKRNFVSLVIFTTIALLPGLSLYRCQELSPVILPQVHILCTGKGLALEKLHDKEFDADINR
jgi:hypothetical protein